MKKRVVGAPMKPAKGDRRTGKPVQFRLPADDDDLFRAEAEKRGVSPGILAQSLALEFCKELSGKS